MTFVKNKNVDYYLLKIKLIFFSTIAVKHKTYLIFAAVNILLQIRILVHILSVAFNFVTLRR